MKKLGWGGSLIVLVTLFTSFTVLHKFYVSVTQIEYDAEEESLQIISRIFIDDIEDLIQVRYDESIVLSPVKESEKVNAYVENYFSQKFELQVNGTPVDYTFLGKEYKEDMMICYLEVKNIKALHSITVKNLILTDLFEEQKNIVHLKKGEQRKSLMLESGNGSGMLKFSE
ncbi:DUF6702 family protein [Aquimarina brevivitae]|uniref:Peptidase E n=1 Tax=Aquimarina brevivitae TaxID=323412 RepID=A0A4Q7NYB2_9FLAO|nr:DUF6702 family protein [Aquimarina brevivitae]RZS91948.1 hypothetical protein EV197_3052 [Aquimarina brevivitae]